jgi:outer membrane protein assembly factor BamB
MIDLGEVSRGAAPESGSAWPGRGRARRPGSGRRWRVTAAAALLMLTATAAASPSPPWATLRFTIPAPDGVTIDGDLLYAMDGAETGRRTLTAYRLADGTPAWESTSRAEGGWFAVQYGIPFHTTVSFVERDGGLFSYVEETTALDPATGRARWTLPGSPIAFLPDGPVVLGQARSAGGEFAYWEIHGVDTATGQEMWRLPITDLWSYDGSGLRVPRYLVSLTDGGQLSSYDIRTGARLATTATGLSPDVAQLSVADRLVLVGWHERGRQELTAYDVTTLDRRWTTDLSVTTRLVRPCGPVLCAAGDSVLYALDPATGARAWSADLPRSADGAGGFDIYHGGPPWPPGHLLAFGPSGSWILDATTGEPVLGSREWRVPMDGRILGGTGEPILTRYHAEWREVGRTWFGRVRDDPVRIEVLGTVDGLPLGCAAAAGHLACRKADQLHVWRVRE